MKLWQLDNLISAVCPIYGVSSSSVISFKEDATNEQKIAAQTVLSENINNVE